MVYLFIGQDSYRLNQAISRLKEGIGAGDLIEANFTSIEADKIQPVDLGLVISAMPFLAPRRLVVVSGLLERFEGKSREKKKTKAGGESEAVSFADVIRHAPESTILVIRADAASAKNPLFRAIRSFSELRSFGLLNPAELTRWIIKRAQSMGGKITPGVASVVSRRVGPDLWAMSGEIDKLVLFAGKEQISIRMVDQVVSYEPEANIFKMVDAVIEGDSAVCQGELERLIEKGMSPQQIMAMLMRQLRMITIARSMLDHGSRPAEIQRRLAVTHDFIIRKTLEQARNYSIADLKTFYAGLVEADLAIKTSRMSPVLTLNLLVAKMAGLKSFV